MPTPATYAFFGNRFYVLEAMLEAGLDITHIGAVAGSYLDKELSKRQIAFTRCSNKKEFLDWLEHVKADRFIANGCPYKVPQAVLERMQCINIHPSYLPDLRGADPIPAAILFGRDSGATCHVMDAGVDTGDIIAQIKLPYDPSWNALTLYSLCFKAEAEVFKQALARDFAAAYAQEEMGSEIYYSFKEADLVIDFSERAEEICRKVLAFNTPNKYARIVSSAGDIKITHANLEALKKDVEENKILAIEDGKIFFSKKDGTLVLEMLEKNACDLSVGSVIK